MILNRLLAALVIGGAAASAVAQSDGASGDAPVGKVNAVYVREARGLFIEKKLVRSFTGKELWVDVRAASQVAETAVGELFEVPADIVIERGDLVATRIGDPSARNWNLIPEVNRVTSLAVKHDTSMPMAFGLNAKPAPGLGTQAHACYAPTRVASAGEVIR